MGSGDGPTGQRAGEMNPVEPLDGAFSVLVVCTGNICRSCVAERLLSSLLPPTVAVGSAGTHGLIGHPIAEPMVPLLRLAGGEPDGFASRQLTERMVRDADLILTMTREHRVVVVELSPAAVRRVFTLREFSRLLADVRPSQLPQDEVASRLRAAIPLAAAQRRQLNQPAEVDDVADPYGQPEAEYLRAFKEIQHAVLAITAVVNADSKCSQSLADDLEVAGSQIGDGPRS